MVSFKILHTTQTIFNKNIAYCKRIDLLILYTINKTFSFIQASPHLSYARKNLYGRKFRPKSVVDSTEGLLNSDASDFQSLVSTSQTEGTSRLLLFKFIVDLYNITMDSIIDAVSGLTSPSSQKLQHIVKSRPKRVKTRAPTRPMLIPENPNDGLALGEGLDIFFRPKTPTTPIASPISDDKSVSMKFHSDNFNFINSRVTMIFFIIL